MRAAEKEGETPSFSRSSLSTTTTNLPCAMAAAAASTVDHIERPADVGIASEDKDILGGVLTVAGCPVPRGRCRVDARMKAGGGLGVCGSVCVCGVVIRRHGEEAVGKAGIGRGGVVVYEEEQRPNRNTKLRSITSL